MGGIQTFDFHEWEHCNFYFVAIKCNGLTGFSSGRF